MAHVEITGRSEIEKFFNVDKAVGKMVGKMREDDITLIQWMMEKLIHGPNRADVTPPQGVDRITVDGKFGNITAAYILNYQQKVRRTTDINAQALVADGRVDPAEKIEGSISHKPYTIIVMSVQMKRLYPGIFSNPLGDPNLPPVLRTAMQNVRAGAFLAAG